MVQSKNFHLMRRMSGLRMMLSFIKKKRDFGASSYELTTYEEYKHHACRSIPACPGCK
jgi:hypothetical protein